MSEKELIPIDYARYNAYMEKEDRKRRKGNSKLSQVSKVCFAFMFIGALGIGAWYLSNAAMTGLRHMQISDYRPPTETYTASNVDKLKSKLHDPWSLEVIEETRYGNNASIIKYRAKNKMGGYVLEERVIFDHE